MKIFAFFFLAIALLLSAACSALPDITTRLASPTPEGAASGAYPGPAAAAQATGVANLPLVLSPGRGQTSPSPDIDLFSQQLAQAVESRDFDLMRSLMGERFSILTWNTVLQETSAAEAIGWLRSSWLAEGSTPAVRFGTDVPALLGGADPLAQWGPVAEPVRAMHVMGLAPNASQEAVLVIGRDPASGQLYWLGILVPPDGYFHAGQGASDDVLPTDVGYIMALDDINMRSGPGMNYAVEGLVYEGQIAQVTGKSADGGWWRVVCPQDASGNCWVSADPGLTEPTTAP